LIRNKMQAQQENKAALEAKIDDANHNLEQYKKQSMGSKIVDQNSILKKVQKGKKQQGININEMLNSIKKKIGELKKQDSQKEPLQLLYDLEATAIKLVEQINFLKEDPDNATEELKAEVKIYKEYAMEKREKTLEMKLEDDLKKRERYTQRGKQDNKHYGRFDMVRSERPKIKKVQKERKPPQYVIDYQTYLGDIADLLLMDHEKVLAAAEGAR